MKQKNLIWALLLMVAGLQTVKAQKVILYYDGKEPVEVNATELDSISFVEQTYVDGYEYVDLGLPSGTMWATCNVGADSPEKFGTFFAWGETSPKQNYSWEDYQHCNRSYDKITKYCTDSSFGTVDDKCELDPEDDAATVNWGENWQMPSRNQIDELIDHTTAKWTIVNDVEGMMLKSKYNHNSIFLPAGGIYEEVPHYSIGAAGCFWSRTLDGDDNSYAFVLNINIVNDPNGLIGQESYERSYGFNVRPVLANGSKVLVTSIQVSPVEFNLYLNETARLTATVMPEYAENKEVTWKSDDESIAIVDSNGKVTAKGVGTCAIICNATDGSKIFGFCLVNVRDREYVDLGLPSGTLWATMNIGADSPEGKGTFYAWGETTTKSVFAWNTYEWMNEGAASGYEINKYTFADGKTEGCWYDGDTFIGDNIKKLLPEDDVATANWGEDWQMPTAAQFAELFDNRYTSRTWTTQNGMKGYLIQKKTDANKRIFLPAAGYRDWIEYNGEGTYGNYWSRSLDTIASYRASQLFFHSSMVDPKYGSNRFSGYNVRAVRVKPHESVDLGLPSGTLWATCNVGASDPEEYGYYFAWGETTTKSEYLWENYKYGEGSYNTITKYCSDSDFGYNGFTDTLTELLPEDDAATANWGNGWQMPSFEQCMELTNSSYTTTEWTTQDGVYGRKITSRSNGNSIFLPAAGYCYGNLSKVDTYGYYWSRSLSSNGSYGVNYLLFGSGDVDTYYDTSRNNGYSVRPVRKYEALKK